MAQALCFGQIGFAASERLFRSFSLRGVPPYPAISGKASSFIKYRQPGDRDVAFAALGCRAREFEIAERQVGVKHFAVLAPGFSVGLEIRHLPARLADLGAGSRRVGQPSANSWRIKRCCASDPNIPRRRIARGYETPSLARSSCSFRLRSVNRGQKRHPRFLFRRNMRRHQDGHAAPVLTQVLFSNGRDTPNARNSAKVCISLPPLRRVSPDRGIRPETKSSRS